MSQAVTATTPVLDFTPAPGAASFPRIVSSQARFDLGLMLRNGEQVLLTLVIPIAVLVGLAKVPWIDFGSIPRIDVVTPGVFALAVMSTAFTAQAISTGFDRRYGVLKLLGSTPLTRRGLLVSKTLAIAAIEVIQVIIISAVALLLGWSPTGNAPATILLLILGTAAFSALALAMAGALRAEATLAAANAVFLLLLMVGGTVIPNDKVPHWLATFGDVLPSGALGSGLRGVLTYGDGLPWGSVLVLLGWICIGTFIALRSFKWE